MKMRKLTALVLSAALALGLCAVAPAAEHMSNFQKTASYTGQFKDVWSGAWYADSAKICYEYGLMQGTYGKFNPRGTVTVLPDPRGVQQWKKRREKRFRRKLVPALCGVCRERRADPGGGF